MFMTLGLFAITVWPDVNTVTETRPWQITESDCLWPELVQMNLRDKSRTRKFGPPRQSFEASLSVHLPWKEEQRIVNEEANSSAQGELPEKKP